MKKPFLFLDIDGVLFNHALFKEKMFSWAKEQLGGGGAKEKEINQPKSALALYEECRQETGAIDTQDFVRKVAEYGGDSEEKLWGEFLTLVENKEFIKPSKEIIKRLAEKFQLAFLSRGNQEFQQKKGEFISAYFGLSFEGCFPGLGSKAEALQNFLTEKDIGEDNLILVVDDRLEELQEIKRAFKSQGREVTCFWYQEEELKEETPLEEGINLIMGLDELLIREKND